MHKVSQLILELGKLEPATDAAGKHQMPSAARPICIELYDLLGQTFLLALDVLDHAGLTLLQPPTSLTHTGSIPKSPVYLAHSRKAPSATQSAVAGMFAPASALPTGSRKRDTVADGTIVEKYEVRLNVWHCSCIHFAAALYCPQLNDRSLSKTLKLASSVEQDVDEQENDFWGGKSDGTQFETAEVPVCKHLLAACLVQYASGLFGQRTDSAEKISLGKLKQRLAQDADFA
ncbi:hypothetical protein PYCC9005_003141 [Savitreella phatthalungensis]